MNIASFRPAYGQNVNQNPAQQLQQRAQEEHQRRYQARLSEVISHENAHASAGGRFAGAPVIEADPHTGIVNGHVPIRMDFGATADEAEKNSAIIAAAACAPGFANMSGADKNVYFAARSTGPQLAAKRRHQEQQQLQQQAMMNPFAQPLIPPKPGQNPFAS